MIASAGVRMLLQEPLDSANILVIAVSLGLAFSIPSQEHFVKELPEFLAAILSSKVATAGLTAIAMNCLTIKTMKS